MVVITYIVLKLDLVLQVNDVLKLLECLVQELLLGDLVRVKDAVNLIPQTLVKRNQRLLHVISNYKLKDKD